MAYAKEKVKPLATVDKLVFVEKAGKGEGYYRAYISYQGFTISVTVGEKIYSLENGKHSGKKAMYGSAAIFKASKK